jgi:phosphatidylglycerophosphate synthase
METTPNIIQAKNRPLPLKGLIPAFPLALGLGVLNLTGVSLDVMMAALLSSLIAGGGVVWLARKRRAPLGWANQVTLARLVLVSVLASALLQPTLYASAGWWLTGVALLGLVLDGLDGWLARRLGESSAFGARFDMEVDAALILILSIGLWMSSELGSWVLLLGAMRYGFVLSASVWPWLDAPLPPSFRRKLVCVWQVCALILALIPISGLLMQQLVLLAALAGLVYSFAVDVRWLWARRAVPFSEQVMS